MLKKRLAAYTKPRIWQKSKKTVVGHLAPIAWDDEGAATKFSIYTYEDDDLIVEGNYRIDNLKKLINKPVYAIGFIREQSNGDKFIDPILVREHKSTNFTSIGLQEIKSKYSEWGDEFSVIYP